MEKVLELVLGGSKQGLEEALDLLELEWALGESTLELLLDEEGGSSWSSGEQGWEEVLDLFELGLESISIDCLQTISRIFDGSETLDLLEIP